MIWNMTDVRASWTPYEWVEKYRFAYSGPYNKAAVALTFDDGPDPVFTPQILDKLKAHGVKATFFLLGENVVQYPEIVKRIAAEGHQIGNHTFSHPDLTKIDQGWFQWELQHTDQLIKNLVGYSPRFFRPTYGGIDEPKLAWATKQDYMTIQWTIDTLDWEGRDKGTIANTVTAEAMPGSIILQHNAAGVPLQGSVDSLDIVIPALKQKGARFVTLSEMFGMPK